MQDQRALVGDVIGVTPFEHPNAGLVRALQRAGALGVLDLGRDAGAARQALDALAHLAVRGFGVRIPDGLADAWADLPEAVAVVIAEPTADPARWRPRVALAQVTSLAEARAARAAGFDGLIVKGQESGGRVGEETAFVLLQRLAEAVDLPLWVQGGVGPETAAACIAGGAAGVVLDAQLALVQEARLPAPVRAAVERMDGADTVVTCGHRIYTRPDLPMAALTQGTEAEVRARLGVAPDLRGRLLPAGQDAAFARSLAARFRTAGGVVQGIRKAIAGHLRVARARRPLAAGGALAAAYGLDYPIVQGPMTRVSDRAEFAAAVAEGGGLPFLALSLMRGPEVRALLAETAARLQGRPWGVGILGFVPPELREEQLAALQAVPPPVALIAGGRPAQARPLEARGIRTWLHVPSPGLLELFLGEGARRFIFEGRECGGHVGPRSSFVLWQQQIDVLLGHDRLDEVEVLFAGGIHDGRSAAMVAAMAAPLLARGVKMGVLMGTAYLFTEEAVRAGAILPGFQAAALACENTVLLETAPGHATRCVDSQYVQDFREARARLEAEGAPKDRLWAELEALNLGRLRIAAKGLRRDGDQLVEVGAGDQQRDGMFMIGQVAALRDRVVAVADLHREVGDGATERLAALAESAAEPHGPPPAQVAIIGMACVFPDAPDVETFWVNVLAGHNAITEVPSARWSVDTYYDPSATGAGAGERTPSKWGGFIHPFHFDPVRYGIPPRSLPSIEPVQLLALEVARRALEDAGYADREFDRERASVIFGAESGTDLSGAYGFRALFPQYVGALPPELDAVLPRLTEDSFPGVLANVIAGRIANRLDLGGVNYTVDAACASSLAAVDLAVKELATGASDLVVVGGADLHNSINDYLLFSSVHALSPRGQCRTFDAGADGIVLGEGAGCLVLKRLADAERDGDRIYAVLQGIGGSSDGRALGLTAPRKEGQKRALERAYRQAGIAPEHVELVEAHGTGTVAGDRTELATLAETFAAAPAGQVTLGSVKSQIGHTKCAAGMAGLIKVALGAYHGVLPPTFNIERPNPGWDPVSSPFHFTARPRPWLSERRVGAVSAFGFGGTNFHAVVAAHPDAAPAFGVEAWPAELFLFRGADAGEAQRQIGRLRSFLETDAPLRLRDLACSVSTVGDGPVQIAIVARSVADLRGKLDVAQVVDHAVDGVLRRGPEAGAVAFLFPGQGSQRPGMLRDLFVAFPEMARLLRLAPDVAARMFPPAAFGEDATKAQQAALTDTRMAQPALGLADVGLARLLLRLGVRPAMAGGHSYGELAALGAAGALDDGALIALSRARAEHILRAGGDDPGTMAAVSAARAEVEAALAGVEGVVVANDNAPRQVVISGTTPGVEAALARLRAAGLRGKRIPVACAFHSPVIAEAARTFGEALAGVRFDAPAWPVWSNVTAAPHVGNPAALLARQVAEPVRFVEQIEAMYAAGARTFVEVGPGKVLSGLTRHILGDRPHLALACDGGEGEGVEGLLRVLAALAVGGVPVDAAPLFEDRGARRLPLERAPALPRTTWLVDGHYARPLHGDLPPGAMRPVAAPVGLPAAAAAPAEDTREQTVLAYLEGVRTLVAAQRDVMLRYLGDTAPLPVAAPAPAPIEALPPPADAAPVVEPEPAEAEAGVLETLLGIVSEQTGYPVEMLGLDLDLEGDLSIDSIKRVEILGELGQRLNLGGVEDQEAVVEALAGIKTLRGIVEWLERRNAPTVPFQPVQPILLDPEPDPEPAPAAGVSRYVLRVEAAAPPRINGLSLDGKTIAITRDGRGVADELAALIAAQGADVRLLGPDEAPGDVHGLVELSVLAGDALPVRHVFDRIRQAVLGGAGFIVAATGRGGRFGRGEPAAGTPACAGVAGLLKTVAREHPDVAVRIVDVDAGEAPAQLAKHLRDEILTHDDLIEVGYVGGARYQLRVVAAPLVDAAPPPFPLDRGSLVLLTGGARGITARIAIELARRVGCKLALVGRTPLTAGDEPPEIVAAADAPALRKVLMARGMDQPAAIEAECRRVLAERAIRRTLATIEGAGAEVSYHAVDVRDAERFGAVIEALYAQHGRIDGVIHGAGVLEDRLLRHADGASFERVFETKIASALTLAGKLRDDVRFIAFFASVSGAFGNRGQSAYAAANDALDKLAWALNGRTAERVVSIDWGPWAGTGMVSAELAREYARRGIELIPPEAGVECFFEELRRGASADAQVVWMAGDPTRTWEQN